MLQHSLRQSYIDVHITEFSQSGFTATIMADGGYDLMLNQSSSVGGTMNIIQRFLTAEGNTNVAQFYSEHLEELYLQAIDAPDYEAMLHYYALIQQYIAEQVPMVPLVQQYLWAIGSANFSGAYLGNQNYTVHFTNARVVAR
jgi:ABC-type transport system substrate-binding protein